MFIYDESKSVYDNLHLLVNEYNRLCAMLTNEQVLVNNRFDEVDETCTSLDARVTALEEK